MVEVVVGPAADLVGLGAVAPITVGREPFKVHNLSAGGCINFLKNVARVDEANASRALVPQNIRVGAVAVEPVRERRIERLREIEVCGAMRKAG
jgi:hypothetical protein